MNYRSPYDKNGVLLDKIKIRFMKHPNGNVMEFNSTHSDNDCARFNKCINTKGIRSYILYMNDYAKTTFVNDVCDIRRLVFAKEHVYYDYKGYDEKYLAIFEYGGIVTNEELREYMKKCIE